MSDESRIRNSNTAFVGGYAVIYLAMCGIFMGKFFSPLLFFAWIVCGWKISSSIAKALTHGSSVSWFAQTGLFLSVLAVISIISKF